MLRRVSLALLLLAGCGSTTVVDSVTPAAGTAAGIGFIDSVVLAPENAAAGGTAGAPTKRIAVRMADNTLQFFDTRASGLKVGDRVEITADGNLKHGFR